MRPRSATMLIDSNAGIRAGRRAEEQVVFPVILSSGCDRRNSKSRDVCSRVGDAQVSWHAIPARPLENLLPSPRRSIEAMMDSDLDRLPGTSCSNEVKRLRAGIRPSRQLGPTWHHPSSWGDAESCSTTGATAIDAPPRAKGPIQSSGYSAIQSGFVNGL